MFALILITIFVVLYLVAVVFAGRYLEKRERKHNENASSRNAVHNAAVVPAVMISTPPSENVDNLPVMAAAVTTIPVIMMGEEMYQKPISDAEHLAWIADSQGLAGHDGPFEDEGTDVDDAMKAWIDESKGHAGYDAPF